MEVVTAIDDVRRLRWAKPAASWGFVPTMGALHAGHISLVERARNENDFVGVSIFINPTQFNDPSDLEKYPRTLDADLEKLALSGVDVVWTPTPEVMYPQGFQTGVILGEITTVLEGAARPGHFKGVATVVAKLLNIFQPTRAYFGRKDAQQLAVIQRMVADLNINTTIVPCPTVREPDGLAMSSRNALLTPDNRARAGRFYQSLLAAKSAYNDGIRFGSILRGIVTEMLYTDPTITVDYISVADPLTLQEIEGSFQTALVSGAIYLGNVRLIDNIILGEDE